MWRKGDPSALMAGMQTGATTVENSMDFLKRLKVKMSFDLVFPLLGIYLKNPETSIEKNLCTPMFIAELFIIAKIWKQPKCPLVDEWIKKENKTVVHLYNGIVHSRRKEGNPTFCESVDGTREYYAK